MNLNNAKMTLAKTTGRSLLIAKKYAPEMLIVTGMIGLVTSTVLFVKANEKANNLLDNAKTTVKKASTQGKKELSIAYVNTGYEFIKLYGPSVTLGAASVACILGSQNIMKKRNVALIAAYKTVEQGFSDYRKRVVDQFGKETDHKLRYGVKEETFIEVKKDEETGKEKKVKTKAEVVDPNNISVYAKFFDESCPQWTKTPEYNLLFLKSQQNYANDLLRARGHVFLNEVYDMLGLPHTQAGAVVGWIMRSENSDNFVDFGIFDFNKISNRDFVNGYERSILLDFNVDGVIYDLI